MGEVLYWKIRAGNYNGRSMTALEFRTIEPKIL